MANISLTLYTNCFIGSVLMSPIQMGSLRVNNSVTNISRLGTFKISHLSYFSSFSFPLPQSFHSLFLSSALPFFRSSFLPFFLSSFLPSFLPFFLHFFLSRFSSRYALISYPLFPPFSSQYDLILFLCLQQSSIYFLIVTLF
jgi:hypothetical protein